MLHKAYSSHILFQQNASEYEFSCLFRLNIEGLKQERRKSIATALELHLSCPVPSIWKHIL